MRTKAKDNDLAGLDKRIYQLEGLSKSQLEWINHIRHHQRDWFIHGFVYPVAKSMINASLDNINLAGQENLKPPGNDISYFFVSNHEGHADYYKQLIAIHNLIGEIPVVAVGEQLFNHWPRFLFKLYFESTGFKIPREGITQEQSKLLSKYEAGVLLDGADNDTIHHILMYPGMDPAVKRGGCSKNGEVYEFAGMPFMPPLESQVLAHKLDIRRKIQVVPQYVKNEIETAFALYGNPEYEARHNKDLARWMEMYWQKRIDPGQKGESFIGFMDPIDISNFLTENVAIFTSNTTEYRKMVMLASKLKDMAYKKVMDNMPLLCTDIAAYVIGSSGEEQPLFSKISERISELMEQAAEMGIPLGSNIKHSDSDAILRRALIISESQKHPIIRYNFNSRIEIADRRAFDRYVRRASQLIEHHAAKSEEYKTYSVAANM